MRFQITLEQDGGGHTIHHPFALLTAHIGGDQQLFGRLGSHPLVPGNHGNRKRRLQLRDELPDGLDGGTFLAAEPQRQAQEHAPHIVRPDQLFDMRNVPIKRAALIRFERLRGPSQFVA